MIVRKTLDPRIIIRIAWKRVLLLITLSAIATLGYEYYGDQFTIATVPVGVLGTALAILLGFRINSAYERWWEGRRLWGSVVNESRTLARQFTTFISEHHHPDAKAEMLSTLHQELVYRQIAFALALKHYLRGTSANDELQPYLQRTEINYIQDKQNPPLAILQNQGVRVFEIYKQGYTEDYRHMQIDTRLTSLTDALGGCERIKKTIFPRQYGFYSTLFIAMFSIAVPFVIVRDAGWQTLLWAPLIGFVFFALDAIARGIENPFDGTINDTPMSAICRTIEIDLRQQLGENVTLEPIQPTNGFLS